MDGVRSFSGGGADERLLAVRQRVEARYGLEGDAALAASPRPAVVTVGTSWGGDRTPEFAVAVVLVTAVLVPLLCPEDRALFVTAGGRAVAGRPRPLDGAAGRPAPGGRAPPHRAGRAPCAARTAQVSVRYIRSVSWVTNPSRS